jgi:putative DNA primase/helicase
MSGSEFDISTAKVDAHIANQGKSQLMNDKKDHQVLAFTAEGEPIIYIINGREPDIVDACESVLANNEALKVFNRAGGLVQINQDKNGSLVIVTLNIPLIKLLIGRSAKFLKWNNKVKNKDTGEHGDWVKTDAPRPIAEIIHAKGHYPKFRVLNAVIKHPTIDLDGRIIDTEGYDKKTGLYQSCDVSKLIGYQRPKDNIDLDEAQKACSELFDIFKTLDFAEDSHKSALIAALMASLSRPTLPSCPAIVITASMPGSGKTKIAECLGLIINGEVPAMLSLGNDDSETEKRLVGACLVGRSPIVFDNVESVIGSVLLCQIPTNRYIDVRLLGGSGLRSFPTNFLLVFTGNNLTVKGDFKRRVMMISLDPKVERPEHRTFENNLTDEVLGKRGEIISAALTITKAYIAAGSPSIEQFHPYGSFEIFDKLIRQPLMWLGLPDPLLSAEALRTFDIDLEVMKDFLSAWLNVHCLKGPQETKTIINVGMGSATGGEAEHPELKNALLSICLPKKVTTPTLNSWLHSRMGMIVDGHKIEFQGEDTHSRSKIWEIVKC